MESKGTTRVGSLVDHLNAMVKDGRTKDKKSWQATFRDEKAKVSRKVASLRAGRAATGNMYVDTDEFSDYDKKLLGLIGCECVEGDAECPDSFADEKVLITCDMADNFAHVHFLNDGVKMVVPIPDIQKFDPTHYDPNKAYRVRYLDGHHYRAYVLCVGSYAASGKGKLTAGYIITA